MNEADVQAFKQRVREITQKYTGASEAETDVIMRRIGERLAGKTHAEAVALHPLAVEEEEEANGR